MEQTKEKDAEPSQSVLNILNFSEKDWETVFKNFDVTKD